MEGGGSKIVQVIYQLIWPVEDSCNQKHPNLISWNQPTTNRISRIIEHNQTSWCNDQGHETDQTLTSMADSTNLEFRPTSFPDFISASWVLWGHTNSSVAIFSDEGLTNSKQLLLLKYKTSLSFDGSLLPTLPC